MVKPSRYIYIQLEEINGNFKIVFTFAFHLRLLYLHCAYVEDIILGGCWWMAEEKKKLCKNFKNGKDAYGREVLKGYKYVLFV